MGTDRRLVPGGRCHHPISAPHATSACSSKGSSASRKPTLNAGATILRSLIPNATYAARIVLDLSQVTPHVSGPDTVQTMQSLAGIEKKRIAIQKAYLVSCVELAHRRSRIRSLGAMWEESGARRETLCRSS